MPKTYTIIELSGGVAINFFANDPAYARESPPSGMQESEREERRVRREEGGGEGEMKYFMLLERKADGINLL